MEGASEQDREGGRKSSRAAAWIAWSIWALCLLVLAFSGVLGFLSASAQTWFESGLIFLYILLYLTYPTHRYSGRLER